MKKQSYPLALLLCGVLFTGCEKDEEATYGVYYQLTTSNPTTVLGTSPTEGRTARMQAAVSWKSGSAVARRIRFEGVGDTEIDIRTGTPTNINQIGPATSLGMISLPAGDYEEVRFTIELSHSDPFQLTGDYNGTPLVLQVTTPIDFVLDEGDLSIAARTNYNALTTLNLSQLLNGISASMLSDAMVSNGQILISPSSNVTLYNLIVANMKDLGALQFDNR